MACYAFVRGDAASVAGCLQTKTEMLCRHKFCILPVIVIACHPPLGRSGALGACLPVQHAVFWVGIAV